MPLIESKRRLTVVQILPALESGGVERGTLEVGKYLVEHGHRSIVISAGGRLVEQLKREGSEHFTWDVGHKSLFTLLRYVGLLRRFLHDEKVDIMHVRSRMPGWVAYLAWKGMDPAYKPHLVTTVHGLYSVNAYSAVMVKGERVIAVSETVRDYILTNYPTVPRECISVIYRGVDPKEFHQEYQPTPEWLNKWRSDYPQLIDKFLLLLPGRITRLKGHEDFIELMNELKKKGVPAHGLIVGGAQRNKQNYLAELHRKIDTANLKNDISFTGQRNDLREIMAISDLVFSLSNQPESFGRTVLEALSLGTPVVGYAHGGVKEILTALYPMGSIRLNDVSQAIEVATILLKNKAYPTNAPEFTLETMLRSTLRLYLELTKRDKQVQVDASNRS